MPPEAVSHRPNYTEKIDCFSFGILAIQIITQEFPNPEDRYSPVDETQNTWTRRREIDRRQNHIDLIPHDHALLPIALDCLNDNPTDRPSAQQLSEQLVELKSGSLYQDSVPKCAPRELMPPRDAKPVSQLNTVGGDKDGACVLTEHFEGDTEVQGKPSAMKLTWVKGEDTRCRLFQWCDAVQKGNLVYFKLGGRGNHQIIHSYDVNSRDWSILPPCKLVYPTIIVVDGQLIAIGDKSPVSNQMYTLRDEGRWVLSQYPPMPTKRYLMIAVCTETSLIVAGGMGEGYKNFLSKVEVLDLAQKTWSMAANLPMPLMRCSATLCGENLYVLSGRTLDYQLSPAVFTCSIRNLIESCQLSGDQSSDRQSVWTRLANVPVVDSTAVSVQGRLLAVGGAKESNDEAVSSAVHLYHPSSNSWEVVSHMTVARFQCFATLLPNGQLMVVGGGIRPFPDFKCCRDVEFATVTYS